MSYNGDHIINNEMVYIKNNKLLLNDKVLFFLKLTYNLVYKYLKDTNNIIYIIIF